MSKLLEKMKEKKYHQISSVILIICLLGSVVLSGHISGVHAISRGKATPSNAEEADDGEEFVWKKASASDAKEDWASPSDASPSNVREYEQLTLEDDSEPVSVSGIVPVGTCLRAEVITEGELSDYGLESLELQDGRAVFAYDLELWLDGEPYDPEYSLQVQIENTELLEGELKLFRISRNAPEQETGSSVDKEGVVHFAMKETGAYAAVDFREAETLSTVQDPDGIVSVTGVLPEGITVTAEKLPDETIRQLKLPEGEIACAYDIKLWVDGEEYQPEKAVKVKILNQKTETADAAAEKQVVSHIVTDEQGEMVENNEIQPETDESGNLTFLTDHFSYFVLLTADENNEKTLDLAEGNIVITDTGYQYVKNGISQTGTATSLNTYTITQTNVETVTSYTIQIGTADTPVKNDVVVYLAGINVEVTTQNAVPVYVNTAGGTVYLILKNGSENIVKINSQSANIHAAVEKKTGTEGTLCITCEAGFEQYQIDHLAGHVCESDGACGKLKAYANCSENRTENTSYYCGAGIGSRGYAEGGSIDSEGKISVTDNETLYYLTIAGGNIESRGAAGSAASGGGAGIGSGSACASNVTGSAIEGLNITGGYIDAWGGDNSAACVGGGYRSNYVHVNIYGGTVNATNRTAGIWNEIRGAGIGAGGGGTSSGSPSVAKVKIYGGTVTASSTYGAGIGGAGGGDGGGSYTEVQSNSQSASVEITGGTITATSNGNGAAIGTGGPLGTAAKGSAGKADVTISGGTIEASSESGADIGGGGVVSSVADSSGGGADIRISGGTVTAAKGGIGGGKANAGTGGDANVTISRGYVKAPSIGGGDSTTNQGGSASITVENAALVELTGGIGGGNSTLSETTGNGGYASVTVTGGTLKARGKVGGGSSAGSGSGGNASVSISGGTLICASIGGGDSTSGIPGSVTAQKQDTETGSEENAVSYGVEISGGKIITGTIGGGTSQEGSWIGFASAHISGGTIQGQFLLENTAEDKKCVFTMTGGTVDNQNLENITTRMQKNGGAVYLNDPKGEVRISGGNIRNCVGILGGAVYMENGTFELSGTGVIENCSAAGRQREESMDGGNGGAVYLANGIMTVSGGMIRNNQAAANGAGVYVSGGKVTLDGTGTITGNTARIHGGGVFVKDGDVLMYQGSIDNNETSGGAGGGIYINAEAKDAKVVMLSGTLSNNHAHTSGGGLAAQSGSNHHITVQIGTCETHTDLNLDTGTFTEFGYSSSEYSDHSHVSCPAIRGNSAGVSGGAFYLNSSGSAFQFFCLKESGNKAADTKSNAMKVEGGNVVIGDAQNDNQNARGKVSMENTILVQGGSVDVHGNMKNPYFVDQITVDIQNSEHHYVDHRAQNADQGQYRVQYYENFTGTDGNKAGLYIAKQYPKSSLEITIDSALFVHGGWHIVGWNTEESGSGTSYKASQQVNLSELKETDGMKDHTLTLYAIWERSIMYTVVFYSNIPLGVACSGTMANRPCTVGENLTLPDNQYQCTGYRFQEWNTKTDGTGTAYSDKAVIENGLTRENGATIKLYAQWAACEHPAQELTYKVNGEKNGWIQICSCGAHTAEAILQPVDAVYDQAEHPAQIVYREDKWSGPLPQLTYEWRKAGSTGSYEEVSGNPIKAGQYRVAMPAAGTVSGTGDETVSVWEIYMIAKADQQAPENISYTLEDGSLTVEPLAANEEYQSGPVYGIMYTTETGTMTVEQKAEDKEFPNVFDVRNLPLNSCWKIFAYYAETENYLESKKTAVGFYKAVKANVRFQLPQGVTVEDAKVPDGENAEKSALWYYIKLEDGYHKDQFQCSAALTASESGTCSFTKYQAQDEGDLYQLTFAPADGVTEKLDITVTISGAAPDAKISAMRKAGQFFEDFNGEQQTETAAAVQVNRDSAFTVQFDVADQKSGDYQNPSLAFHCALPEKTTVIMQTEADGDADRNAYWYYTVTSGGTEAGSVIPLSAFKKMGAAENTVFDFASWKTGNQTSESYRFVTSFANADWTTTEESTSVNLTLSFEAVSEAKTTSSGETVIPALSGMAAVTAKKTEGFSLENISSNDNPNILNLHISTAAIRDTKSSFYGKQAILVLQQEDSTGDSAKLSKDLHLEVQDGDATTVYPVNAAGQYIVPLGNTDAEKTLSMRFASDTYYFSAEDYPVKAELYVSASEQADYSIDGKAQAALENLAVVRSADELPSVRVDTQKRLYRKGESMSLPVEYAHVGQSELETKIWERNTPENIQAGASEYVDTMVNGKLGAAGSTNSVSLGNLEAGSYCLIISVSRTEGETVRMIMEVPWYFIITDQNQDAAS